MATLMVNYIANDLHQVRERAKYDRHSNDSRLEQSGSHYALRPHSAMTTAAVWFWAYLPHRIADRIPVPPAASRSNLNVIDQSQAMNRGSRCITAIYRDSTVDLYLK